jgi:hypothetical protein
MIKPKRRVGRLFVAAGNERLWLVGWRRLRQAPD